MKARWIALTWVQVFILSCSGACATVPQKPTNKLVAKRPEEVLTVTPNEDLAQLDHQLRAGTSKSVVVPRALLRTLIQTQKLMLSQYKELQNELDALKSIDVGTD